MTKETKNRSTLLIWLRNVHATLDTSQPFCFKQNKVCILGCASFMLRNKYLLHIQDWYSDVSLIQMFVIQIPDVNYNMQVVCATDIVLSTRLVSHIHVISL